MLAFSRPEKRLNDFLIGVCYVVQYRLVADKSKHPGLYTFDSFRNHNVYLLLSVPYKLNTCIYTSK